MTENRASVYRKSVRANEYWVGSHLLRAGDIVNSSSVTGTTVSDALDTISASGAGPVITLNGITAQTQTFATSSTGTSFAVSSSGTTHTFSLPDASATAVGAVTTGAQTLAGVKTLSSAPILSTSTLVANGNTQSFPSTATTLLGVTSSDTVTNKSLVDSSTQFTDNLDATKVAKFQCSGIGTGTTRTLTLPTATTTLVGTDTTQILTNKTIAAGSGNDVTATNLYDGINTLSIGSAPAAASEVLTATGPAACGWLAAPGGSGLTEVGTGSFDGVYACTTLATTTPTCLALAVTSNRYYINLMFTATWASGDLIQVEFVPSGNSVFFTTLNTVDTAVVASAAASGGITFSNTGYSAIIGMPFTATGSFNMNWKIRKLTTANNVTVTNSSYILYTFA